MEKRSIVGTVILWVLVLLTAGAVVMHTTPTGRTFIRKIEVHVPG